MTRSWRASPGAPGGRCSRRSRGLAQGARRARAVGPRDGRVAPGRRPPALALSAAIRPDGGVRAQAEWRYPGRLPVPHGNDANAPVQRPQAAPFRAIRPNPSAGRSPERQARETEGDSWPPASRPRSASRSPWRTFSARRRAASNPLPTATSSRAWWCGSTLTRCSSTSGPSREGVISNRELSGRNEAAVTLAPRRAGQGLRAPARGRRGTGDPLAAQGARRVRSGRPSPRRSPRGRSSTPRCASRTRAG